jgi:hypothetical protein
MSTRLKLTFHLDHSAGANQANSGKITGMRLAKF